MRYFILIISTLYISSGLLAQELLNFTLEHDGMERNYLLYIPASYEVSTSDVPLVFNFHGFTSNAQQQMGYSNMNPVADEHGFIICYPNGVGNAWNVNWNFGSTEDDLGFTQAMIENINADYNINLGRVYACGMSNGGFFSYWLACNLADQFAAVASVTGSFSPQMLTDCSPSRSMPVMEIHGTDDNIVPYEGMNGTAEPIEDVIAFWRAHNICTDQFEFTQFEDLNSNDDSTVSQDYYQNCNGTSEVLFMKVEGGGHSWPNSPVIFPGTNLDIDASIKIWEFFDKHEIDAVNSNSEILDNDWTVYPNPASDILRLEGIDNQQFFIADFSGKVIMHSDLKTIDISNLDSGIYFISLQANGKPSVKRFIKH